MADLSADVLAQALQLPEEDRGRIADELIASLHPPDSSSDPASIRAAWIAECRRRMADSDAGATRISLEEAWPRIVGDHA